MLKRAYAALFLGSYLVKSLFRRQMRRSSPHLKEFRSFYRKDRIPSYAREDQDPSFSNCISCGLCDSLCPALIRMTQKEFPGPSSVPFLARSIPHFAGNAPDHFDLCQGCRGCEEICPTGVPIKKIIKFIREKGRLA